MNKQNKKKVGYKQYERLLALAHQKLEILAQKYQAFHENQSEIFHIACNLFSSYLVASYS